MNAASEVQTFRCSRLAAGFMMLCSLPFVGFGLLGLWAIGIREGAPSFFAAFVALGLLGTMTGIAASRATVTVRSDGITRSSYLGGFNVRWDDVESWRVVHVAIDDRFEVRFRVRGRWLDVVVPESEVYRPGFEAFLSALRSFAPEREAMAKT